ncbi:MAG: hypothetical protein LBG73_03920 [Spirochaetaceae bacterium]|nr:hypothetical protein [Spirochaetaceae bacterium]
MTAFLSYLKTGEPVTALVAPAAWSVLPDFPKILGVFRALGVRVFFPVLPYADITAWAYYRFLKEAEKETFISSACVGIRRNFPDTGRIGTVYSPLLCAARYLKTYRGIRGRFAFFSPCDQKRFEFTVPREHKREEALVHFNITIADLSEWLASEGIDAEAYPAVKADGIAGDGIDFTRGLTVAYFGTISAALSAVSPDLECAVAEGLAEARRFYRAESLGRPRFFEPYACVGGCANGSGVPAFLRKKTLENRMNTPSNEVKAALLERFTHFDRMLDIRDFCYDR